MAKTGSVRIGISGWTYLDNDMQVRAPFDATALMARVEVLLQSPMRLQP